MHSIKTRVITSLLTLLRRPLLKFQRAAPGTAHGSSRLAAVFSPVIPSVLALLIAFALLPMPASVVAQELSQESEPQESLSAEASLDPADSQAEEPSNPFGERLQGRWVINDQLSTDTDDEVERAIKAAGGRAGRGLFNNEEDFYRGGPPEHELYDRVSYDDELTISYSAPEFRFIYEDNYERVFHTDGRRRRTTAADFYSGAAADWSFGYFEGESLIVEGQPRDGGFTIETYTLIANGSRLRIEMLIQPDSFAVPVKLVRVFDRR